MPVGSEVVQSSNFWNSKPLIQKRSHCAFDLSRPKRASTIALAIIVTCQLMCTRRYVVNIPSCP